MLSKEESAQLKQYSMKDSRLKTLFQRLEREHQMELSRISHEIRNPVTLINSYLQLTQSRYPQITALSTWAPIIENMEFLKSLLDEFSRYNHAGVLYPQEIYLPDLLDGIARDSAALWNSVEISFHKLTAIPLTFADQTKLKEAVLNLIRNGAEALKDMPNGYIHLTIAYRENFFVIQVINNGPEISPEHIDQIFDPFVSFKKDGTGLGLPIVKCIAQAHQGSVTVSSSSQETCFTIRIPLMISYSEAACTSQDKGAR